MKTKLIVSLFSLFLSTFALIRVIMLIRQQKKDLKNLEELFAPFENRYRLKNDTQDESARDYGDNLAEQCRTTGKAED